MLRDLVFFTSMTGVPCQTSYPDVPLQNGEANHYLYRCFIQRFCCFCGQFLHNYSTCAKDVLCASCSLHLSRCVVSSVTKSSVMSTFPCLPAPSFSVGGLGQAIGHPMHGHLLGMPVRAVRLLAVFQTRWFHRVQQLLQHMLLECLHNEQQHN